MGRTELGFLLGGAQGAGLETSASILAIAFANSGYGVLSDREYFSNIKGRHSYIHSRVSSQDFPSAMTYPVQIVGAMDAETVFTHCDDLENGGYLIYDVSTSEKTPGSVPSMERELVGRLNGKFAELGVDGTLGSLVNHLNQDRKIKAVQLNYPLVLTELAKRFSLRGSDASRYVSSIMVGAVAGLVNLADTAGTYALERRFTGRPQLIEQNSFLIKSVADTVRETLGKPMELAPSQLVHDELMVLSGNDVVAMAKVVGGLRYQSYYPITPAADESFLIETAERLEVGGNELGSVLVVQTEDEISAVNSAIGAALTGARSATATSGPGFSLMAEGLGWAGMNEVPLVITHYQRGGPSTGQPTRGSQSDLLFVLSASHGEFPRIVLASGDHVEAFYDAMEVFNLAEKYQTPVIHLLDKYLANSISTTVVPDLSRLKIDRGDIVRRQTEYKRFSLGRSISPRALVGGDAIVYHAGDEHDQVGHIDEDPLNRVAMYEKRMKKLEMIDREIPPETRAAYLGAEQADMLLVGWGFVKGVAVDVLKQLERKGIKGAYLHLRMFLPFPSDYVRSILSRFDNDRVMCVEHNYLAQAGRVIALNTGILIDRAVVKFTGRPMYTHELADAVEHVLTGERKVVLTYGQ